MTSYKIYLLNLKRSIMKQKENIQENQIRKLITDTKVSANENLKFRIMQQIETESVLAKNKKKSSLRIGSLLSTFSIIYGCLIALVAIIYFGYGVDTLMSTTVLSSIIAFSAVGSVLWMILVFDEKVRSKRNK